MNDRFTVRAVVLGLLLVIVLSVVATVVLAISGDALPDYLKYVGTTALGAFAGVLAKTGTDVQPVAVVNKAADPVPTAEAPKRRDRGDLPLSDLLTLALIVLVVVVILVLAHVL